MNSLWTKSSLSRDFALLVIAAITLLLLISIWVTQHSYDVYSDHVEHDLKKEANRIDGMLHNELERASYVLTALGQQIVVDNQLDMVRLAQVLKSYDSKGSIYSIISWVNASQKIVVSSNRGVLEKPVDVSDRDYVQDSSVDPWKMHIGSPIEGRVSGKWVLPVAMGVSDYTGKLIGTILISLDIGILKQNLASIVSHEGTSFAIVSRSFSPLVEHAMEKDFVSAHFPLQRLNALDTETYPDGLLTQGNILFSVGNYFYYHTMTQHPYLILLGYDLQYSDRMVSGVLVSRLLQFAIITVFFLLFLWIMRTRMIQPMLKIASMASAISRGESYTLPDSARVPEEVRLLAKQISHISEYIAENKRIEDELRNKLFVLKKAKERAEASAHSKSEFLAYVCQEMRSILNHVIGFSQAMRDQLHGPIENKKYRGYASDIYIISNTLLNYTQDLLTFSKTETGYTVLLEKPLDIEEIIAKTLRFLMDRMQIERRSVTPKLQENLPKLIADEFRLQQLLTNMLVYAFHKTPADQPFMLEAFIVREGKDKAFFVISLHTFNSPPMSAIEYIAWADRIITNTPSVLPQPRAIEDLPKDASELSLELFKSLVHLHHGYVGLPPAGEIGPIAIFFPQQRIHTPDKESV